MSFKNNLSPNYKLLWTSLPLLLIAHTAFGWLLYDWTSNRSIWLLVAFGSMVLGGIVTYPSRTIAEGFHHLFRTDTRAFILICGTCIISVFLITSVPFFFGIVILITAGLLVSLDLRISGWRNWFILCTIVSCQLFGLTIGLDLHYLSAHPIINVPAYLYFNYWLHLLDAR